MTAILVIPPAIDAVIEEFDQRTTPFNGMDVSQALKQAREKIETPSDDENYGAWSEILAFTLVGNRTGASPWGTYFSSLASGQDKDGKPVYWPDIADADAQVITHWTERAARVSHPALKARYADLVWDLTPAIAKTKRSPLIARVAIDAYLECVTPDKHSRIHDRFFAALRAVDLAVTLNDSARLTQARSVLIGLHREVILTRKGPWWYAYDRLIADKQAAATDQQTQELVGSLEDLAAHYGDTDPAKFDPHQFQDAAKRLIRHYTRVKQPDDVRRLHTAIARTFEHFAAISDAMVASSVLQTAVNAFRDAGLTDDSRRTRILMEQKIGEARDLMIPITAEVTIPKEDVDRFLANVVTESPGETFVRIAAELLPNRRDLEAQVQKTLEDAPFMAIIPSDIMAENHVAAKVGSVEEDPFGRLIQQASMNFQFSAVWLQQALVRTTEVHQPHPEHFAAWANRLGLFDDMTFILEGVRAWYGGDHVKAVHVLVPQVEYGLRAIAAKLGRPVSKAHPKVKGVGVAIGMGDILYSDTQLTDALGPDLTLYFLALYADPRGWNLRNELAHGLIRPDHVHEGIVRWLIHTLLVFGIWDKLAEKRR
jgi:lysyl-tRNA synthetase class 1